MKTTGGVQKHHVIAVLAGVVDSGGGDLYRVDLPHLKHRYADLFTDKLAAAQSGETLLYRVTDAGFAPMQMEVSAR